MKPLLEIQKLVTNYYTEYGIVHAVDEVSFTIPRERTVGIVGESGCGKSVTAMSVMGLIQPPGKIDGGAIIYHRNGKSVDLAALDPKGGLMRSIRGNEIAMIFQEPMTSLNPVFTVGRQIMESIMLHQNLGKSEARQRAVEMLQKVGIPLADQRVDEYPHQLSGGMRQRAMIAMALSCNPSLLIADEPTTALDVTIQAQVLDLMMALREEFKTSIMMITHDLGVVAGMADEVIVMYLGRVVEQAPVRGIFNCPKHPYTKGLLESVPAITSTQEMLRSITGVVPDPFDIPRGCRFAPRCSEALDQCNAEEPPLCEISLGHMVACWKCR